MMLIYKCLNFWLVIKTTNLEYTDLQVFQKI
jgi:hypothetical protein